MKTKGAKNTRLVLISKLSGLDGLGMGVDTSSGSGLGSSYRAIVLSDLESSSSSG